jgi:hypothetical protein
VNLLVGRFDWNSTVLDISEKQIHDGAVPVHFYHVLSIFFACQNLDHRVYGHPNWVLV